MLGLVGVAERESVEQRAVGLVFTGFPVFVIKIYPQMYPQKKF